MQNKGCYVFAKAKKFRLGLEAQALDLAAWGLGLTIQGLGLTLPGLVPCDLINISGKICAVNPTMDIGQTG